MISEIKLTNFRKFTNTVFEFNKNLVIFYGHNAQGKSSVLEALYLINTGLSPWASTNEFVKCRSKFSNTYKNSIGDGKSDRALKTR